MNQNIVNKMEILWLQNKYLNNKSGDESMEECINKIHQGNAIELAKIMPDDSVDMVFTSPPYSS